jgi:hypothetical protein
MLLSIAIVDEKHPVSASGSRWKYFFGNRNRPTYALAGEGIRRIVNNYVRLVS